MNPQPPSVTQTLADPLRSQQQDQFSDLTDEQRAFAKVVGQALAKMWLKEQEKLRSKPAPTPPQ